jgi:hypothetical protein
MVIPSQAGPAISIREGSFRAAAPTEFPACGAAFAASWTGTPHTEVGRAIVSRRPRRVIVGRRHARIEFWALRDARIEARQPRGDPDSAQISTPSRSRNQPRKIRMLAHTASRNIPIAHVAKPINTSISGHEKIAISALHNIAYQNVRICQR